MDYVFNFFMIIFIWNIRGLNDFFKQKEFRVFLLKNKIDIFGCLEIRVKYYKDKKIIIRIDSMEYCCNYEYVYNGRIWLM